MTPGGSREPGEESGPAEWPEDVTYTSNLQCLRKYPGNAYVQNEITKIKHIKNVKPVYLYYRKKFTEHEKDMLDDVVRMLRPSSSWAGKSGRPPSREDPSNLGSPALPCPNCLTRSALRCEPHGIVRDPSSCGS